MSSRDISSGLRKERARGMLRLAWSPASPARVLLSCSAAAELAPGPENADICASGSDGIEDAWRGEANKS